MLSGTLEVEGGTFSNIWNYAIKSARATISEGEFQDNLYLNQDNVKLRGGIFSSIYVADDEGEIAQTATVPNCWMESMEKIISIIRKIPRGNTASR